MLALVAEVGVLRLLIPAQQVAKILPQGNLESGGKPQVSRTGLSQQSQTVQAGWVRFRDEAQASDRLLPVLDLSLLLQQRTSRVRIPTLGTRLVILQQAFSDLGGPGSDPKTSSTSITSESPNLELLGPEPMAPGEGSRRQLGLLIERLVETRQLDQIESLGQAPHSPPWLTNQLFHDGEGLLRCLAVDVLFQALFRGQFQGAELIRRSIPEDNNR